MKKRFYLVVLANILLCQAKIFADPLPIENMYFERPVFLEPRRGAGGRILYASAHSAGAVAVTGATVVPFVVGTVYGVLHDRPAAIVMGAIGSGCAFTGGMYATKALGGNRAAVAAGCVAGLVTLVAAPEIPLLPIFVTAAVAGTIAGFEF